MATQSSIPAWRIPMDRSLAGYSPWGRKSRTRLSDYTTTTTATTKEENPEATKILLPCPVRIYLCETRFSSVHFN